MSLDLKYLKPSELPRHGECMFSHGHKPHIANPCHEHATKFRICDIFLAPPAHTHRDVFYFLLVEKINNIYDVLV